ncbi:MAG: hypothetical protein LUE11_00150 [Clostridia bacterium]|nr:hypothetical protein [Clostridia bacterium]
MYKGFLENLFDVNEDGELSIPEDAMNNVWMQMFTKDSSNAAGDMDEDDSCDEFDGFEGYEGENFDEEEELAILAADPLPMSNASAKPDVAKAPAVETKSELDKLRAAIKKAGFDPADVNMLYEDEIQEALENAGLDTADVLNMDSDPLREALLYVIDASLTFEAQMKQDLTDAGFDLHTLAEMGESERSEALEDAGFEPEDFEKFNFQTL